MLKFVDKDTKRSNFINNIELGLVFNMVGYSTWLLLPLNLTPPLSPFTLHKLGGFSDSDKSNLFNDRTPNNNVLFGQDMENTIPCHHGNKNKMLQIEWLCRIFHMYGRRPRVRLPNYSRQIFHPSLSRGDSEFWL